MTVYLLWGKARIRGAWELLGIYQVREHADIDAEAIGNGARVEDWTVDDRPMV